MADEEEEPDFYREYPPDASGLPSHHPPVNRDHDDFYMLDAGPAELEWEASRCVAAAPSRRDHDDFYMLDAGLAELEWEASRGVAAAPQQHNEEEEEETKEREEKTMSDAEDDNSDKTSVDSDSSGGGSLYYREVDSDDPDTAYDQDRQRGPLERQDYRRAMRRKRFTVQVTGVDTIRYWSVGRKQFVTMLHRTGNLPVGSWWYAFWANKHTKRMHILLTVENTLARDVWDVIRTIELMLPRGNARTRRSFKDANDALVDVIRLQQYNERDEV